MNTLVIPVTLLELDECFPVTVDGDRAIAIELDSKIVVGDGTYYEGPYDVIPKAHDEVVLQTEGYLMADDVTVKKIPYYETSNLTGKTVYIADEVNYGN